MKLEHESINPPILPEPEPVEVQMRKLELELEKYKFEETTRLMNARVSIANGFLRAAYDAAVSGCSEEVVAELHSMMSAAMKEVGYVQDDS